MKIKNFNLSRIKRVKPGTIRITTIDNRFYNDPPYLNTKTNLPFWFKRIHKGDFSIRSCSGVSDFLEYGFTIPAWTTYTFKPNIERGVWDIGVDEMNPIVPGYQMANGFNFEQTGSCPMTERRQLEKMSYPKLITPWRMQTAPGWSSLILPILYEENDNYSVMPAIVNTDYYQMCNIVLNVKTNSEFSIKQGTPLAHVIPICRKGNIRNIESIDESFFKYASSGMYLLGGNVPKSGPGLAYRKAAKVVDSYLDKN